MGRDLQQLRSLTLRTRNQSATHGVVTGCGRAWPCSLGRSGRRARKREGDGATPIGIWHPIMVYYRCDRVQRPRTRLPIIPIRRDLGWCDANGDRNYNRPVRHPYPASAERLWRDDHLYDLVVVLSHNRVPRVQGGGSAIFMHLARPGYRPTEGCIALTGLHLRFFLGAAGKRTRIVIPG